MKTQTYLLGALFFVLTLSLACSGGEGEPSAQDLAFENLSGSWDISQGGSIIIDGNNATANFVGFALSFDETGYNTLNAGELFSATGTWTWADEEAQQIDLDDGKRVTIESLTESEFVFSFQFSGAGGQANLEESISGSYTITVNKP